MSIPERPKRPELPVTVDLFALVDWARTNQPPLPIPGKVLPLQGSPKKDTLKGPAPIITNSPPTKPTTNMGNSKVVPPVAAKSSALANVDENSQKLPTLPTNKQPSKAALGEDLGADEPTVPELGDTTTAMGEGDSPDMGDSSIGEPSEEPGDQGADQLTEGQGGEKLPKEPKAAPVRKPKPRNTPTVPLGQVNIKGSKLKGTISGVSEDRLSDGDRLFRCRPNGDCYEILPESDEVTPKPRKKPRKRRR